MNTDYSYQVTK